MKNIFLIIIAIFLFTSCSSKKEPQQENIQSQIQIANYLNESNKLLAASKQYKNIFEKTQSLDIALKLVYIYRYKVKDEELMIKWYEKALELNCKTCNQELAMYYYLKDDKKNTRKYLLEIKDLKKYPLLFSTLEYIDEKKKLTKKNLDTISHYKRNFQRRDLKAGFKLAQFYENRLYDIKNALKWYAYSFDMGYSHSAYFQAVLYDKVLKDHEKALLWYKKAYNSGQKNVRRDIVNIYTNYIPNIREKFIWSRK